MLTTFTTRQTQINDTPKNKIREQLDNETKINKNNNNTILQHDTPLEKIQITARKYTQQKQSYVTEICLFS